MHVNVDVLLLQAGELERSRDDVLVFVLVYIDPVERLLVRSSTKCVELDR